MAKFGQPLLVNQISGALGGVVFGGSRSGPSIRVRSKPTNPRTTAQTNVRADLTAASRGYKGLSTTNAQSWRDYAAGFTFSNGVGGTFVPSGINMFTRLGSVFLAVTPGGTLPTTPPSTVYTGDTITITGGAGAGDITFTASAANTAGSTTELLVAKVASPNRLVAAGAYRIAQYHVYVGGALVTTITKPAGYYALAYRFVKIATGERGPIVALGVFQAT